MSIASALRDYLPENQIRFLEEVVSALQNMVTNDDRMSVNECPPDLLQKIMVVAENTSRIIHLLKSERIARRAFLADYPAWNDKWRAAIDNLKQIAKAIENDTFNCNVSRLVAYLTSLAGGKITNSYF